MQIHKIPSHSEKTPQTHSHFMGNRELKQNLQILVLQSLTAHILDAQTMVQIHLLQGLVKCFTEYYQCKTSTLVTINYLHFLLKGPWWYSLFFHFPSCVRIPQVEKYDS